MKTAIFRNSVLMGVLAGALGLTLPSMAQAGSQAIPGFEHDLALANLNLTWKF